jgi:hypothetical protein
MTDRETIEAIERKLLELRLIAYALEHEVPALEESGDED